MEEETALRALSSVIETRGWWIYRTGKVNLESVVRIATRIALVAHRRVVLMVTAVGYFCRM